MEVSSQTTYVVKMTPVEVAVLSQLLHSTLEGEAHRGMHTDTRRTLEHMELMLRTVRP